MAHNLSGHTGQRPNRLKAKPKPLNETLHILLDEIISNGMFAHFPSSKEVAKNPINKLYSAVDTSDNQQYSVWTENQSDSTDDNTIGHLSSQVSLLSKLQHPNLMKLIEVILIDPFKFIVFEHVNMSLIDLMNQQKPSNQLPELKTKFLVSQVSKKTFNT